MLYSYIVYYMILFILYNMILNHMILYDIKYFILYYINMMSSKTCKTSVLMAKQNEREKFNWKITYCRRSIGSMACWKISHDWLVTDDFPDCLVTGKYRQL